VAVRPVVQHPDPALRVDCMAVTDIDDNLRALAADMLDTMYDAQGRGLAAPQVGMTPRMFVMDVGWKQGKSVPRIFINPEVTWASAGRQVYQEACLSISGQSRRIARPAQVALRWLDSAGQRQEGQFAGAEAVIVQHEIDHLDGILMIDHPAVISDEPG